jgi:hypothetical protein
MAVGMRNYAHKTGLRSGMLKAPKLKSEDTQYRDYRAGERDTSKRWDTAITSAVLKKRRGVVKAADKPPAGASPKGAKVVKTTAPAPAATTTPVATTTPAAQVPWKWNPSGDYMDARNRLAAEYAKAGIGRSGMYASAQSRAEVMDKERQVRDENAMRNMMLNYGSQLYNTDWARYIQELQVRGNDTGLSKPQDFAYMPWLQNFDPSNPLGLAPGTTPAGQGQVGDAVPGELLRRYEPNLGATLASRNADRDYGLNRERLAMQREQLDMAKAEAGTTDDKLWQAASKMLMDNFQWVENADGTRTRMGLSLPSQIVKNVYGMTGLDLPSVAKDVKNPRSAQARAMLSGMYEDPKNALKWWGAATAKPTATKASTSTQTGGFLPWLGLSFADIPHRVGEFAMGENKTTDSAFDKSMLELYRRVYGKTKPALGIGYQRPHYEEYITQNWNK